MARTRAKRLLLLALMGLAAVNLFTGAPLFAIWVGSRVQGDSTGLSMTAVLAVVVVLALVCWALVWALDAMGAKHARSTRSSSAPSCSRGWRSRPGSSSSPAPRSAARCPGSTQMAI